MKHNHSPLDLDNILSFIEERSRDAGPKVTIYFSVPRASDFAVIGHAELKGLVHTARMRMKEMHISTVLAEKIGVMLDTLLHDGTIWQHRAESYVIFASHEVARFYALPIALPRGVWVNQDFHITPLIPLFLLPEYFFVLHVSLAKPRLLRVHPEISVEMDLSDVFAFEESRGRSKPIVSKGYHTSRMSKSTGDRGIVVPHGGDQDEDFHASERYLMVLTHTVNRILRGEDAPLVIMGTKEVVSRAKRYIAYHRTLVSDKILDVPLEDTIAGDIVWRQCAEIYKQTLHTTEQAALDNFEERSSKGAGAINPLDILSYARTGGVDTLLVEADVERDGEASSEVTNDPDLVNAALVMTLKHHGHVVEVEGHPFPAGVAAILRPQAVMEGSTR